MHQTKIETQIAVCQNFLRLPNGTHRSYDQVAQDALKRMKSEEKQTLCYTCGRFKWGDMRCELYDGRDS